MNDLLFPVYQSRIKSEDSISRIQDRFIV